MYHIVKPSFVILVAWSEKGLLAPFFLKNVLLQTIFAKRPIITSNFSHFLLLYALLFQLFKAEKASVWNTPYVTILPGFEFKVICNFYHVKHTIQFFLAHIRL
jgi:hypothetical protein